MDLNARNKGNGKMRQIFRPQSSATDTVCYLPYDLLREKEKNMTFIE